MKEYCLESKIYQGTYNSFGLLSVVLLIFTKFSDSNVCAKTNTKKLPADLFDIYKEISGTDTPNQLRLNINGSFGLILTHKSFRTGASPSDAIYHTLLKVS